MVLLRGAFELLQIRIQMDFAPIYRNPFHYLFRKRTRVCCSRSNQI